MDPANTTQLINSMYVAANSASDDPIHMTDQQGLCFGIALLVLIIGFSIISNIKGWF